MKILITGATGLVGKELVKTLLEKGYNDLHILTRNPKSIAKVFNAPIKAFEWDPYENLIDEEALRDVDAIIHLAGENIGSKRWSEERKKEILESRVLGTELLVQTVLRKKYYPQKFLSSSAVGIYGNTHSETAQTDWPKGDDFLAAVCQQWENALLSADIPNCQKVCLRTGIVLSPKGGALEKMLPPFKLGVGGVLGSGEQYMSWVHIQDLVNMFLFLIEHPIEHPAYNAVSPNPVTNAEFTKTLGSVLNRPTLFPVPAFVLKALFGEMSTLLLEGQKVLPSEFLKSGYHFQFPILKEALENVLKEN